MNTTSRRSHFKWAIFVLAWTVLGLFWGTRWYILAIGNDNAISLPESMALSLLEWYLWAAVSILVFWMTRQLPFDRSRWWRSGLIHLAVSLLVSTLHILIYSALFGPIDAYFMQAPPPPEFETFTKTLWLFLKSKFHASVMTYTLIAVVSYAWSYYQRYRQEEIRASELRAELANVQLQALRAQLHPHFLFNTLHAISTLMREDIAAAEKMLNRLSDLLRFTLKGVGRQTAPLGEEIEFVQRYLEIEKVRFSDRLRAEIRMDSDTESAAVPYLILQPLVENAIKHGISPRAEGGAVRITAQKKNDQLLLQVADDGAGLSLKRNTSSGPGLGLANVRERLKRLYGDRQRVSLATDGNGFTVSIEFPFQEYEAAETETESGN